MLKSSLFTGHLHALGFGLSKSVFAKAQGRCAHAPIQFLPEYLDHTTQ